MAKHLFLFDGMGTNRTAAEASGVIKPNDEIIRFERDKTANKLYDKIFKDKPNKVHTYTDVREIATVAKQNPEVFKNIVSIFGGFPCTSESKAGKHEGILDPNTGFFIPDKSGLVQYFLDAVRMFQPKHFLAENTFEAGPGGDPSVVDEYLITGKYTPKPMPTKGNKNWLKEQDLIEHIMSTAAGADVKGTLVDGAQWSGQSRPRILYTKSMLPKGFDYANNAPRKGQPTLTRLRVWANEHPEAWEEFYKQFHNPDLTIAEVPGMDGWQSAKWKLGSPLHNDKSYAAAKEPINNLSLLRHIFKNYEDGKPKGTQTGAFLIKPGSKAKDAMPGSAIREYIGPNAIGNVDPEENYDIKFPEARVFEKLYGYPEDVTRIIPDVTDDISYQEALDLADQLGYDEKQYLGAFNGQKGKDKSIVPTHKDTINMIHERSRIGRLGNTTTVPQIMFAIAHEFADEIDKDDHARRLVRGVLERSPFFH